MLKGHIPNVKSDNQYDVVVHRSKLNKIIRYLKNKSFKN